MAQPAQVFRAGGSREYSVIDDGAPGAAIALNSWSPVNPTGEGRGLDEEISGAVAQGSNAFGNGTIPDCVARAALKGTVRFLNPA